MPALEANVPMPDLPPAWHGQLNLRFHTGADGRTSHQGAATAPLKLQRGFPQADGRCELPILHTAGGLVGGDRLSLSLELAAGSRALLTSVAAQKVYGTVGRSRQTPGGRWAQQRLTAQLAAGADLEWLPQELVLYADGLLEQHTRVELAAEASWLGMEVVRLGRTAAGEDLGRGCWRSHLEIERSDASGRRWELVDRLELGGAALASPHGLAGEPVFGSLVWAAPHPLATETLERLLADCRADRRGLRGAMVCGGLDQGLVARYQGPSSGDARHWFVRIWARIRALRGLAPPALPRVWPFQEEPLLEPGDVAAPQQWQGGAENQPSSAPPPRPEPPCT
jgi:urease accessory protein